MKESLGEGVGVPVDAKSVSEMPGERGKFIEDAVRQGKDPEEAGAEYDARIQRAKARAQVDRTEAAITSLERRARKAERREEDGRQSTREGAVERRKEDRRQTKGERENREDKS